MATSPAFQFYVNEWLGSTNITLMSPAEEGAYIRLLAIAWNDPDCSLPDDDASLAVLSRLGKAWAKSAVNIRRCFVPHPNKPGRIINPRLLQEVDKQKEWREKSSEGGKRGAAKRWKKDGGGIGVVNKWSSNGDNQSVTGRSSNGINQTMTLQSSSSSSSSENTDRQTDTRTRGEPTGEGPDRSELTGRFARLMNKPSTQINWGPVVTWLATVEADGMLDLATECLDHALQTSTSAPQTTQGAVKYVSAIYERCRQHDCKPGEFKPPDASSPYAAKAKSVLDEIFDGSKK